MKPIARHVDLSGMKDKKITVWHSNDMYVWIQGMLWTDATRCMQLIPALRFGFVAVTAQGVDWGCVPVTKGYLVFRPCAIEFGYGLEVSVKLVGISAEKMQGWYGTFKPWSHITLPTR